MKKYKICLKRKKLFIFIIRGFDYDSSSSGITNEGKKKKNEQYYRIIITDSIK